MGTRLLTRAFVLLFVAHFLHAMPFQTLVHLPGFLQQLGADEVQIGILVGTLHAAAIVARPLVGRVMDTRGRKIVVLVGGLTNLLASVLYLTIEALGPWVYVVRIVHGLAEGMLFAVLFTVAADLAPSARRTEALAVFGISGLLPLAVGGVLGDWVLARASYTELFIVLAGAAALGVLVSLPVPDSRPPRAERAARPVIVSAFQPDLVPVWFLSLAFTLGIASYFAFLKIYVPQIEGASVGAFFTAYVGAAIVLRGLFAWVPDRFGRKRVLIPALVSLAGGLLMLAEATTGAEVVVAGVLAGIGHGYTFPILSALAVDRARTEERGAAMALFTAVADLGVLIGGPLLGATIEAIGFRGMFTVAAAIPLAGIAAFLPWDRGRR